MKIFAVAKAFIVQWKAAYYFMLQFQHNVIIQFILSNL